MLDLLGGFESRIRLAALPQEDTSHLDGTHTSEEEVHSGEPIELYRVSIDVQRICCRVPHTGRYGA